LRTAAISGLAFTVLYLLHRLLQGTGPDLPTPVAGSLGGSLAGDGVEDALGVVLQLGFAGLEALVGTGGRGGAEYVAEP
jgi:hypothetical protein